MKKFKTVTDHEILVMAFNFLLDRYLKEQERARECPENPVTQARFELARARCEEVSIELLRMERKMNEGGW